MTMFDSMVNGFCLNIFKNLTSTCPAYQSALLTTPLILLRIFFALVNFFSFFRTLLTLTILAVQAFMAYDSPVYIMTSLT